HVARMSGREGLDAREPLCDPRSAVKQLSRFAKWREVERRLHPAERFETLDARREERSGLAIAEEIERMLRHAEAETRRRERICGFARHRARECIIAIEYARDLGNCQRLLDRRRENRDAIEAAASGNDPARAEPAACRLQTDDIVEGGRH